MSTDSDHCEECGAPDDGTQTYCEKCGEPLIEPKHIPAEIAEAHARAWRNEPAS